MPRKPVKPKDTDCGCSFQFDADGRPEILCPDEVSQDLVFEALRLHPDLAVRINVLQPEPKVLEGVPVDGEGDDLDLVNDESDEDGDLEFDDDVELEDVEEDGP